MATTICVCCLWSHGLILCQPPSLPCLGLGFPCNTITSQGELWYLLAVWTTGFKPHSWHTVQRENQGSRVQEQQMWIEGRGWVIIYLERLNPDMPEREASSMSGVTIFSVMSVSTVKVGSTMKSMKPDQKCKHSQAGERRISVEALFQCSQTTSP